MLVKTGVWTLDYSIIDAKGKTAHLGVYLPKYRDSEGAAVTIEPADDPHDFALALGAALDRIITGRISRVTLSTVVASQDFPYLDPEDAAPYKAAPLLESDVEEGVTLVYRATNNATFQHRIPTIDEAALLLDGRANMGNSDVASWLVLMTTPEELAADWTVAPSDSRGVDIAALSTSKAAFKADYSLP